MQKYRYISTIFNIEVISFKKLANETIFEIFEYLDGTDIYKAFYIYLNTQHLTLLE